MKFMYLIKSLVSMRKILISLVVNELKLKYFGNCLGMVWAFIQPLATILVLWFVFQVGFKAVPVDNVPFILWLSCGMIPWFFISDGLNSGTNSIISNAYLVKKIAFNVETLPFVSILSNLVIHLFFVTFMMVMFVIYGYKPNIYWLQLPYYIFASSVFVLGLSMITSSLVVFIQDIRHLVAVIIQFGFWLTPIFWNINLVPERFVSIISLNPLVHIIDGFRGSLIYDQWFWQNPGELAYFWGFSIVLLLVGNGVFNKLRPMFADVV
ncbi:teichoic acid ABC transporter permease [Vibrio sp. V03_P4A6T147]|nr:teichoic acid ABC transporter permease [Vibrio sp. V03_P4A6T147]